jgi:hypothetical protein
MINRYVVKEQYLDKHHPLDANTLVFKIFDRKTSLFSYSYYYNRTTAEKICERKNSV